MVCNKFAAKQSLHLEYALNLDDDQSKERIVKNN